jgi:hypothetical protein
VITDVTCVNPVPCKVSVKPLENVVVEGMTLSHCHAKEELLHVERAFAHLEAYSCPVPVVGRAGAAV